MSEPRRCAARESLLAEVARVAQSAGVARRARGGFLVEGRWPFGSGIRHADWIFTSAVVAPDAGAPLEPGPPALVSVAVPAAQVRIEA